ncbi:MAG: hypothetical protein ACFFHV_06260 [Promethearchaeota archaeon]
MTTVSKIREVQIICPICKSEKLLDIPESIINQAKQLTTVSIQKGMLCNHHFQAFIDKNFKVRGYQKIDFEVTPKRMEVKSTFKNKKESSKNNDEELFENLIMEGNFLEYNPKNLSGTDLNAIPERRGESGKRKDLSLKEIYDLFWEFIDEDNREFRELIIKDKRRKSLKKALKPIEH